jgi:hypothetical protein
MDGWMDGRRTLIPNHDTRIARKGITPFSFFFCYEPARRDIDGGKKKQEKMAVFVTVLL